jgi:AraC family transcriptional activator FtrA
MATMVGSPFAARQWPNGHHPPRLRHTGPVADSAPANHKVAVHAYDGIAAFELGVAVEVFALPRPELDVAWWYDFALFAEEPRRLAAVGGFGLDVPHGLEALDDAGTVILLGSPDPHGDPPPALLDALRAAHARGARLVSICSGAFVLAAAGLLDGRRAATHWMYADLLAERYPRVEVDARVLYVDGDDVLTSAGTAAGIDLCLHLVRRDHGAEVANRVARRMVVAPHRTGDQAQYVDAPVGPCPQDDPVSAVMQWALERLDQRIGVPEMARAAHLSTRSLTRRFAAATGTSPARWLLAQRIAAGAELLERTDTPVEDVGALVGLPSPAAFRRHFARQLGVAPSVYRRTFTTASAAGARPAPTTSRPASSRTASRSSSGSHTVKSKPSTASQHAIAS